MRNEQKDVLSIKSPQCVTYAAVAWNAFAPGKNIGLIGHPDAKIMPFKEEGKAEDWLRKPDNAPEEQHRAIFQYSEGSGVDVEPVIFDWHSMTANTQSSIRDQLCPLFDKNGRLVDRIKSSTKVLQANGALKELLKMLVSVLYSNSM